MSINSDRFEERRISPQTVKTKDEVSIIKGYSTGTVTVVDRLGFTSLIIKYFVLMISCDKMREDSLTSLSFTSIEQDDEASEDASCNSEQNDHHDDKSQEESDVDTNDNDENCDDGSSISQSTGSIDAAFEKNLHDDDDNDEENNSKKQHEKQNWKWNLSFSSKSTEDNTNSHHVQQRQQHNSQETVHAKEKNYSQKSIEHLEENQVELRAGNVVLSTALTKQVDTSSKGDDKPNRNFGRSDTSEHKKNKKNVESSRRRRQQNRIPHRSSSNRSLGHRSNNNSHHHPQQQQQQQLSSGSRKSLRHSSHHCGYTTDIKKSARRRRSMNINSSRQNEHNGTSNEKIGSSLGDESIHNNTDKSLNYHGNNSDSSKRRVSWKSDSKASFSDWTIKISYRDAVYNQHQLDEYHIHKNVTGFGYRKSEYLLREFQKQELRNVIEDNSSSSNNSSSNNNNNEVAATTTIKLPTEIQARAFPMVLDFLYYTKEIKQKLTAEMSCNIFKLSELLEIPALSKAIGEFYMKNLTLKNLGDFLTAATKARADKLLTICKAKIGQMITENPKLSGFVPPKFMADILLISRKQLDEARLKEPEKYTEDLVVSQSRYWSKAACICAAQNETVLTPKLFERLTSSESLPYIDASATPKLLSIEAILIGNSTTLHTSNNTKTGVNAQQLTSLQERCVESISNDFDTFQKCFDSSQAVSESLKNLPSNVLTEILLKSLNR